MRALRADSAPHNIGVDSACTSISLSHLSLYLWSADMVCLRIASARLFYNPDSYLMLPPSLKATTYA